MFSFRNQRIPHATPISKCSSTVSRSRFCD
jgi:hypothetical protein